MAHRLNFHPDWISVTSVGEADELSDFSRLACPLPKIGIKAGGIGGAEVLVERLAERLFFS